MARLPETYQWLLLPVQTSPQSAAQWQALRLSGQEALAVRASRKLRSEEFLVPSLAGTRLRMELDRVPLWRGDHVAIRQLAEDFARYTYLPRISGPEVLVSAAQDGLGLLLWQHESFAFADGFDEAAGRYRGLRCGTRVDHIQHSGEGLLVKPDVALKLQQERETQAASARAANAGATTTQPGDFPGSSGGVEEERAVAQPDARAKRYYGTVQLDASRVGRDAGRIADEVIAHLSGLIGAEVNVTLEIEATLPDGVPDNVIRTVTENSRTLKFASHGFERE